MFCDEYFRILDCQCNCQNGMLMWGLARNRLVYFSCNSRSFLPEIYRDP